MVVVVRCCSLVFVVVRRCLLPLLCSFVASVCYACLFIVVC